MYCVEVVRFDNNMAKYVHVGYINKSFLTREEAELYYKNGSFCINNSQKQWDPYNNIISYIVRENFTIVKTIEPYTSVINAN